MFGKQTPETAELTVDEKRALDLRVAGYGFEEIAKDMGCSLSTAHSRVERALAHSKEAMASKGVEYREVEAKRLNSLLKAIWPVAVGETEVMPKMDDEGNTRKTIEEATLEGQQKAIDRVLRIMERRAKMLGLDAPTQSEVKYSDADAAAREIAAIKAALDARRAAGGVGRGAGDDEPGNKGSDGGGGGQG